MSLLSKVKSILGQSVGDTGDMTWVPHSWNWNFWQQDMELQDCSHNTAVEACVSAITQTVAMMPVSHWRIDTNGGKTRLNSSVARVLRRPNQYQTQTDFFLNLIRAELMTGNGIAYVQRNQRNEIVNMHLIPPRSSMPYVDPETQDVFYSVGGNPLIYSEQGVMIPARDILHIRQHTPNHPLIGETPLVAAGMAAAAGNAIQGHNMAFFRNMSRPSGILTTDMKMGPDQVDNLRARWKDHTTGQNSGGTPILTHNLKWESMSMTAVDAEMVEEYKMTVLDVARAFRVPPPIIGALEASTFNNVESMMKHWISTGLGFTIRHVEESLERLFNLPPNEEIMFDTDILLRSDFAARMEGLSKGVTAGIFSPNEARRKEGLPDAEHGDEPRLQQQVVPLSYHYEDHPDDSLPPPIPEISEDEKVLHAAETLRRAMH